MTVEELIYTFSLKADKLDSKASANIKLAPKIYLLNEGMMELILKRYGGRNTTYGTAIEEIQKRRDEFQKLIVPDEVINAQRETDEVYTVDLTQTKKPYMFLLRMNAYGTKGKCTNRRLKGILTETDDLDLVEGSSLQDSSFEWGDCVYRLAEDKIRMRSDGTFSIEKGRIDYLRYPKLIDMEGYKHFDGSLSTTVQCELPAFMHKDIVDEALLVYASSFTNADLRARLLKLANDE